MIEEEKVDFKLILAQKIFLLQHPELPGVDRDATQQEILDTIFKGDLAPLYQHVGTVLSLPLDASKLAAMREANAAKLRELDEKVKDAEENLGETEVRDLLHAKADYLADIGDKEGAVAAYKVTEDKTAGSGLKVDLVFSQIRLFVLYQDWHGVKALIARAKQLCDEGGDWERKNKLKVYESVFALHTRDFKVAANLALDSTATFTTSELFPYTRIILYAVVASLVSLSRPELKKRVVDAPEILTVIDQLPSARDLLHSLYFCKYGDFFKSLVDVVEQLRADMYLAPHVRYYIREIRVVAYSQFLESYKSVTLDSMAAAFGVSAAFLDGEIAGLIVAGRLNAKIDKVAGVVETSRPDAKNALYQEALKKGDVLLNRIQKLSRVIDIE